MAMDPWACWVQWPKCHNRTGALDFPKLLAGHCIIFFHMTFLFPFDPDSGSMSPNHY